MINFACRMRRRESHSLDPAWSCACIVRACPVVVRGRPARGSATARLLRLPNCLLSPAKFAEFSCPQMCLTNREELIELRRLDGCSRKHAVCLPSVMDLMLKQMHQQTIPPFGLYPRVAIDLHHFVETACGQTLADFDETPINRGLLDPKIGNSRARHRIFPRSRPQPSAFERVDVEMVNDEDVIESLLQAREEAGAFRFELGLREILACNRQTMVRPGIVMSERPISLNDIGGHQDLRNRAITNGLLQGLEISDD